MSKKNNFRHHRPTGDRLDGIRQNVEDHIRNGNYQQALIKLRVLAIADDGSNPEMAHGMADRILLEALKSAGLSLVAEAYKKTKEQVGFWYS